jgi:hypothetical protein
VDEEENKRKNKGMTTDGQLLSATDGIRDAHPGRAKVHRTLAKAAGFFIAFGALTVHMILPVPADAAAYQAKELIRSKSVTVEPGGTASFTIGFKNEGTETWRRDGRNFVSAYTHGPKYRASAFRAPTWYGDVQPAKVRADVPPGGLGMIAFDLRAPAAPGTYRETFHLAAEDLLWVPGGEFTVEVVVTGAPAMATAAIATPAKATGAAFAADLVYRSAPSLTMKPGEIAFYTVGFKNVGTARWDPDSRNFLSIYTFDPKYRKSAFEDNAWRMPTSPWVMLPPATAPGSVGYVRFSLRAPATPGTYRETFHLAAEDLAWVDGGEFSVDIVVAGDGPAPAAPPAPAPIAPASAYQALKMLTSGGKVTLATGGTATYRVGFKNTGDRAWLRHGDDSVFLRATGDAERFRTPGWDGAVASRLPQDAVYPGQIAFFDVKLASNGTAGNFAPSFTLAVRDQAIEGGIVEIPVEVTSGSSPSSVPSSGDALSRSGARGPELRVGLFETRAPIVIHGDFPYSLVNGDHLPERKLTGTTTITFDFDRLLYTVRNGDFSWTTDKHVHFWPDDPASAVFEVKSYENRPTWDPSINFNKFRGKLEAFYARSTGRLWLIEEVPAEDYLRGLAETSNGSPYEYQKALVTAARTYALFVKSIGGKHKSEYFDLNTTGNDQVYKGYVSELVRPNVARAVEDTRGKVVTYGGEIVVTPYFSRSDGRTRAWSEVWGGSRPWLVSKPAPYDVGKTLWGHGVGMSASDALGRAEAGASWTQILEYYYTGIALMSLY